MRSMRVRLAVRSVVTSVVAVTLMTGCANGSDNDPDAIFTPGGAAGSAIPVSTPTVRGAPVDLSLPPDVHLSFDFAPTGDPVKDKIIQDLVNGLQAEYKAVFNDRYHDQVATDRLPIIFAADDARRAWARYLTIKHRSGTVVTGTKRYEKFDVTVWSDRRSALVTYCEDESNFAGKERKNGKRVVQSTRPTTAAYTLVRMLVVRDDETGIWRQFRFEAREGAQECRPAA